MVFRDLIPIAALALLSACVVNLSFEMHKSFQLQSQSAGSVSQTQLVDLSLYKEIQEHRSNIKSLGLDYADASISAGELVTTLAIPTEDGTDAPQPVSRATFMGEVRALLKFSVN